MNCANCGSDNPDGLKFCNYCGAPFSEHCSQCGFDNVPSARFCGQCGTPLNAGNVSKAAVPAGRNVEVHRQDRSQSATGERRHLTVLFCDLVGSTELAGRLDPEELRQTVASYHRTAAEAIERFGGHVAKFLGDGVMAYFGYPEAHDNDGERAALAGLAILEAMTRLNSESQQGALPSVPNHQAGHDRKRLSVRVGIDSGAVVVGSGAGTEPDVFGEAPNIAARIQGAAASDTVLISAATQRLVDGLFELEDRGSQTLRGVDEPLQLYRVARPAGVRGRLAAAAALRGLTSFVGREDELRTLTSRWQRVLDGDGQVTLIVGEPGIGKSRLVQQFRHQIEATSHIWLEAAAAPFYQNTPFYPVAEALWQLIWELSLNRFGDYLRQLQNHEEESGSDRETTALSSSLSAGKRAVVDQNVSAGGATSSSPLLDVSASALGEQSLTEKSGTTPQSRSGGAEAQIAQLHSGLISAGLKPADAIPLLAPLLHLPLTATYSESQLSPEEQRRRLLATLIEWLLGAARAQPLVLFIEDLHWADPSTLELIQLIGEQGATAPILLLCTARPEFHAEWPLRAHHTQITLNRLNARNVREMIAQVAAREAIAAEILDAVVERTSGVPLFVEELTRAVLESGNTMITGREIPVTLHDSLMARLDRLGSAKEVLQIGSVIGAEFSYELLRAVHSLSDENLQRELRRLIDADLLHVRGLAPHATYQFKHALIRDAAYEALLKSRRRELHRLVAEVIDEQFGDLKDAHPEILARHWSEAAEIEGAITEWERAGKAAETRNAFREALENYQEALRLLEALPDSADRDEHELEMRQSFVRVLWMTQGPTAPETIAATDSAVRLAEKLGKLAQLVAMIFSKNFSAYASLGSATLAQHLLDIARREGSATSLAFAYGFAIMVCYFRGDLAGLEANFAAGHKFFDDPTFRQFPGMVVSHLGGASLNAWMLGHINEARNRDTLMMHSVNPASPYDAAVAAMYRALFLTFTREYEQAVAVSTQTLQLSEAHHFPWLAALSRSFLGESRAHLGDLEGGIELLRQGVSGLAATETPMGISNIMAYLASALARQGDDEAALETIERARGYKEVVYLPVILRVRGEVRLKLGQTDLAEADFRESITLARNMGAKAWELRTTMSLARLLDQQGRRGEARPLLAEIFNWFTEGFDTPDLKDARALLESFG
jgi:class 3 adenylate cyclase/tetratricopeptide (TPR) repeat protein